MNSTSHEATRYNMLMYVLFCCHTCATAAETPVVILLESCATTAETPVLLLLKVMCLEHHDCFTLMTATGEMDPLSANMPEITVTIRARVHIDWHGIVIAVTPEGIIQNRGKLPFICLDMKCVQAFR